MSTLLKKHESLQVYSQVEGMFVQAEVVQAESDAIQGLDAQAKPKQHFIDYAHTLESHRMCLCCT